MSYSRCGCKKRAAKARGIVEMLEAEMAEKGIAVTPPESETEEDT